MFLSSASGAFGSTTGRFRGGWPMPPPPLMLAALYATFILLSAVVLMLPVSRNSAWLVRAIFTATSA